MRLLLLLVVFGLLTALLSGGTSAMGASVWVLPVGTAAAALGLWAYAVAVRRVEKRTPDEIGRSGAGRDLVRGTLVGAGVFTAVIATIAVFGGYRITGWGSFEAFLAACGLMAVVAVMEELLFRGIFFRIVETVTGTWGALAVSAVFFGALHLVNPNATLWGALAIALEAGLMLGAAYAATRTLWLPIGIHFGWNVTQAGVFGTAVSGSEDAFSGLFSSESTGPTAITGGAFGPEASVFAVVFCGAVTVYLLRSAHRKGRIVPRRR
ncbi:CAAX amino protease [Nocardiopsis ansamitocini]|uniref:CAAX amino protease n=1 Tax=Nocardiopsis ansamitocini TaxID=1670832 RepID=A0A9W6P9X0_9ACTN|nr:CAAX amino protease [Nocardiopsis ansamitocini]